MVDPEVVKRIRISTCAVHRLAVKHEDTFGGLPEGAKVNRISGVRATAFLVRPKVLVTNRHVIEEIAAEHLQTGNHDHWYVEFLYPQAGGTGWSQTFRRIDWIFALNSGGTGPLDVGLLTVRLNPNDSEPVEPVKLGNLNSVRAGAEVALAGYPLGDELLTGPSVTRFGPVVHAGIISAVAPYDTVDPRNITTFLTDINTAPGMSGSPVFFPDTGEVVGLHYAGVQGTLGCAVPVDELRVSSWISALEHAIQKKERFGTFAVTGGGDVSPIIQAVSASAQESPSSDSSSDTN
ncbi:MAG: serine protease [Actinomycetota bacterium]